MSELDTFRKFCQEALAKPGGFTTVRENASAARALRRRFYYLRTQLPQPERDAAELLEARVIGRFFTICPKAPPPDWAQVLSTGDTSDDTQAEGSIPNSDRLDDSSLVR
jgi:hypothetical protein